MIRGILKTLVALVFAVVALLVTVAAAVLLHSEWRTAAIDRSLEELTGWQWSLETTQLGWNRIGGTEIFAMQGGQGFQFREVDLGVEMVRSAREGVLYLRDGRIEGAFLDLGTLPPAALGLTPEFFLGMVPAEGEAVPLALLVEAALMRLAAQGTAVDLRAIEVEGSVLLPYRRSLAFALTLEEATTEAPSEAVFTVHRAVLR